MNLGELAVKFSGDLSSLINEAINHGSPVGAILMSLEDRVFELRCQRLAVQQEMAAAELASKIVPANGILPRGK